MERIDKVLSNLGIVSRSECKKAVKQGLITVNGLICKSSDTKIDPDTDRIEYKGEKINSSSFVYYMLHKPVGVITATEDDEQATVFDLIKEKRKGLAAVGRLDKDTTGILLITNDGQLNHYLVSPRHHVKKRYEVLIDGKLTEQNIHELSNGMDIGDDKPTLPAEIEILDDNEPQRVAICITEGRYHQVKRMFSKVNCPVLKLHRSDFGELHLDSSLKPGQYRELTGEEIDKLKA